MIISPLSTTIRQLIYFSKPYIFWNWANHMLSVWYKFSFTLLYITKCYESYFLAVCNAIWNLLLSDIIYPNNYSAPFIAESSPVHQDRIIWWHVEGLRKRRHFSSVSAHTKLTDATKHLQWFSPPENGDNFALMRTGVFAEAEQFSVSDVNRLVPEKVFAISSFSSCKTSLHIRNKAQQNRGDRSCNL